MENLNSKRSLENLADADEGDTTFRSNHSNNFAKRQKLLTFSLSETGGNHSYNHDQFQNLGSSATSNGNSGPEREQHHPFADSITLFHSSDSTMTACAFCCSSKITEVSFIMQIIPPFLPPLNFILSLVRIRSIIQGSVVSLFVLHSYH